MAEIDTWKVWSENLRPFHSRLRRPAPGVIPVRTITALVRVLSRIARVDDHDPARFLSSAPLCSLDTHLFFDSRQEPTCACLVRLALRPFHMAGVALDLGQNLEGRDQISEINLADRHSHDSVAS